MFTLAILGVGLIGLLMVGRGPRGLGWAVAAASISIAVGDTLFDTIFQNQKLLPFLTWTGAGMALAWGVVHATCLRARRRQATTNQPHGVALADLGVVTGLFAMTFGVGSAVLIGVQLAMSMVALAADFSFSEGWLERAPVTPLPDVRPLLFLLTASLIPWITRAGTPSLAMPFWLAATTGLIWSLGAIPEGIAVGEQKYSALATGLLRWQVWASVLVGLITALEGWAEWRRRWALARTTPWRLDGRRTINPGVRWGCGILGLMTFMALAAMMVLPPFSGWLRIALPPIGAVCAWGCGISLLVQVNRAYHTGLAEIGLALVSLGFAAGFQWLAQTAASPASTPSAHYAVVFNALMAAFTFLTWFWTWLADIWEQQRQEGRAWTTTGQLIPLARRFAFASACVMLLTGGLLALWPRFPGVATADDTLGRLASGVGVHLAALLVFLRCARGPWRLAYHLVVVMELISLLAFVAVRMLPFAPR